MVIGVPSACLNVPTAVRASYYEGSDIVAIQIKCNNIGCKVSTLKGKKG